MNLEELEVSLRNSEMDYSLKANRYLHGVAFTPCNDCPFKGENPAVSIPLKTQKCFERCPYQIMVWILSEQQLRLYYKVRPPELKDKDFNKAVNEERVIIIKMIQIREIQMKITITKQGSSCEVEKETPWESQS